MVSVFACLLSDQSIVIKEIAFALTFGILFDRFLVRMTVIPAAHRRLGARPGWLLRARGRALPNVAIERRAAGGSMTQPRACASEHAGVAQAAPVMSGQKASRRRRAVRGGPAALLAALAGVWK